MCVGIALIHGLAQLQIHEIGNFWVDLVRTVVRILLPLAVIVTLVLLVLGVVDNLNGAHDVSTLAGGHQTILGGPVASWESIKLMSGDGGGAFNVNSAHPFENPTPLTNVVEIAAMLLIPVAFIRTFGVMVGDKRQGWALFVAAGILFVIATVAIVLAEMVTHGTVVHAVGAATEGTETRFGVPGSALFGQAATASGVGAANASYDSFASLGGGMLLANMMLGEVSPGGPASGLYGLVVMTLLAVFLGGLTVGTTPEYLRQRLQARHIKLVSLYILVLPAVILVGCGLAIALPGEAKSMLNSGPHGLSEVLYAFTSSTAKCFRRVQRQYDLVQRDAGAGNGGRQVPADHPGARVGGQLRSPAARRRHRRHASHPQTHIRRAHPRRHPDHRGPRLSPSALPLGPLADGLR